MEKISGVLGQKLNGINKSIKESEYAYILVTPAKNEGNNLPELIQSIVHQNVKPVAWFIVDDGSDDETPHILNKVTSEYSWIHSLRLDTKGAYDIGEHYASVCCRGFEYAFKYAERNNIQFEYIALSDADMIYPEDYFHQILLFLRNKSEYGIASGNLLIKDEKQCIYKESVVLLGDDYPIGTGRVWRKETFEETNGYIVTKSPDVVSDIMALLNGWKIKRLADVKCYQTRDTGGKINLWDGYFNRGTRAYYLNANFLSLFNVIVDIMLISRQKNSMTKSLAFFCGYFQSFIQREDQIENDEVKRYIGSYKRVIRHYWLFLKGLAVRRRNHEK